MPRENTYQAMILKKQAYAEADEIITFFTFEHGKVRALAKSVKSPKSKLQQKLQALFLVQVTLSHSKFPKIITIKNPVKLDELQGLLSDSIEYQLERQVKSEKYLKM